MPSLFWQEMLALDMLALDMLFPSCYYREFSKIADAVYFRTELSGSRGIWVD